MNLPFMKCGHRANALNGANKPCCAICIGLREGAEEEGESPNLTGRIAFCTYCNKTATSSVDLPFWERGKMIRGVKYENMDSYYCGCRGWD